MMDWEKSIFWHGDDENANDSIWLIFEFENITVLRDAQKEKAFRGILTTFVSVKFIFFNFVHSEKQYWPIDVKQSGKLISCIVDAEKA